MSRRKAPPWAPTSLPQIRRQWCQALGEGLDTLRDRAATGGAAGAALANLEEPIAQHSSKSSRRGAMKRTAHLNHREVIAIDGCQCSVP
jgi:hypothetical protein